MHHVHVCPRCNRPFEHERFVYDPIWLPVQRIVARALHRFYGACRPCIEKFMAGDFQQDQELQQLEIRTWDGFTN